MMKMGFKGPRDPSPLCASLIRRRVQGREADIRIHTEGSSQDYRSHRGGLVVGDRTPENCNKPIGSAADRSCWMKY